jgi:hypothetical protein
MPLLFQPSPPPCAKCGTTTVLTTAFEEGQRVFVVGCPACGRAGTYTLDYSALASGDEVQAKIDEVERQIAVAIRP